MAFPGGTPDGLMIEHRFVISEGNEALAQRTVMGMAGTATRLEVVRIFSRSDATSRGYRCTETLSRGRVCTQSGRKRMTVMLATVTDRQRMWRMARMGICALLLTVCRATASAQPVEAFLSDLPVVWQAPQPLEVATAPSMPELDIGVVLFDPGVERNDDSPAAVVRRLEASLLARELKAALIESNQFGVVDWCPRPQRLHPCRFIRRFCVPMVET